jgi:hypothetical protein
MSEPCACVEVRCCSDNPFNYSLVAGTVYENDQVAIEFECPPGLRCTPGTYVIPKGRIRFTPTNTESGTLRLLCCESEIVRAVPAGSTPEEVGVIAQGMANDCARQLARCTAAQTIRFGSTKYSDEVCYNGCANQVLQLGWLASPPAFPSVIFFNQGSLCLRAGAFASQDSISAATASAQTFLQNYVTSLLFQGVLDCGYWNTEQTCPDSDPPIVIPAYTVFSAVSQEAANAAAIAAGCPSTCCVEPLNSIGPLGFPNYLTYDETNDLVFVACQTQGVKAINPATDTVTGTRFTAGTTYWGGLVYVPITNMVYCCVQIGATVSWQTINPLTMALVGTITPPVGYTFLTNLQPTYDPTGQRIIVAGRRTAGFLPALLQIDVNTGVATLAYLESNSFNGIDFPGAYDSTRNRFVYKIGDFVGGVDNLVILSSAFAVVGTVSLGSAGVSGTTGDLLYVEDVDKIFFSGTTSAGDEFLQLNAATLATEFTIGNTRGSIWFNGSCGIVFQNNGTTVAQWDYAAEEVKCSPASPGFGLGATTETATNKSYIVVQGAAGTVNSLQAI